MKFKRIMSVVAACACTVSMISASIVVKAASTLGDLTYEISGDQVIITDCSSSAVTVTVPEDIMGQQVTQISSGAFEDCSSLTQVTLPATLTTIGDEAFSNCKKLQSINIPSSVTSVGYNAFYGTAILTGQSGPVYYVGNWAVDSDNSTAIEIKSGTVGIADYAFYNNSLETLTIPSTVKTIGDSAFAYNNMIRTLTIPSGVVTIGDGAFEECSNLLKVSIASTVTSIGDGAFYNCSSLSGIKIPSSVAHVGQSAFNYTVDYVQQTGPEIYIDTWLVDCLDSNENIALNVKSGTKGIADYALYNKKFIVSATLPAGLVTVGNSAFYGCTSLSQLVLPETLTTIEDYAFAYINIPKIEIPASVTSIGYGAFYGCSNVSSIIIKNPTCAIYMSSTTLPDAMMYVTEGSTAYAYAQQFGRTFDYLQDIVVMGDATGDGYIDLYDIIAICEHFMGIKTLTSERCKAADYNGDGTIDLMDAIAVAVVDLQNRLNNK